jgi:hypothetical protein
MNYPTKSWVIDKHDGKERQVVITCAEWVELCVETNSTRKLHEINPIVLTPDVMKRCGLKLLHPMEELYGAPYSINGTWANDFLIIDFNRFGDVSIRSKDGSKSITFDGIKFEHLHQLQAAVTFVGQELEFEPKDPINFMLRIC